MHFILTTLGCKVNQYEGAGLSLQMMKHGFWSVGDVESAEIFILNSCTVTENSDRKTRQLLNSAKKKNPQIITVLTGCFPQAFPEEAEKLGADIVCGTVQRSELPVLIREFLKTRVVTHKIAKLSDVYEEFGTVNRNIGRTRAFIKIQDGCNCNCAYCIVPKARGNPRSRPLDDIRKEALAVSSGYKEIVLTGINLTKYEFGLDRAVSAVAEFPEIKRVRLSSVEPDLLSDDILENLAREKKLCPHFHLSLQSGSDSVLKRMSRRYTAQEYCEKVQKIRGLFGAEATFTTDMMTGFPGETEEEFQESLAFAQKINFAKIHVFPFSARPGTLAAAMENQVPESIKKERRDRLLHAAEEMRTAFLKAQIGKTLKVLIEKDGFGHAKNYAPVKIINKIVQRNEILNIKINSVENNFCIGEPI
jgi:threonylcarbamoyladenosine tRNA methylthiotransferase MtaB